MKVVSNEALTKLIQLVKSAFVKVEDVIETQEVTLADVALSGDYDDLINKPTIPSVGNGRVRIYQNNTEVGNFTLNQSTAEQVYINVPTQASDIGAQDTLVSGTNIKTINNTSILGSGNIEVGGSPTWSYNSTTRTLTIS